MVNGGNDALPIDVKQIPKEADISDCGDSDDFSPRILYLNYFSIRNRRPLLTLFLIAAYELTFHLKGKMKSLKTQTNDVICDSQLVSQGV
jgi:hypothetical protein